MADAYEKLQPDAILLRADGSLMGDVKLSGKIAASRKWVDSIQAINPAHFVYTGVYTHVAYVINANAHTVWEGTDLPPSTFGSDILTGATAQHRCVDFYCTLPEVVDMSKHPEAGRGTRNSPWTNFAYALAQIGCIQERLRPCKD